MLGFESELASRVLVCIGLHRGSRVKYVTVINMDIDMDMDIVLKVGCFGYLTLLDY